MLFVFFCSEADEIYKICCVIGSPTKTQWSEGLELASAINYQFPQVSSYLFFSSFQINGCNVVPVSIFYNMLTILS